MRNKDVRTVVDLYKHYYISITKKFGYVLKMNDKRFKLINEFIINVKNQCGGSLGQDYLKSYFDFQFNKRYQFQHKPNITIQIEWIIGRKAFENWLNRSEKQKAAASYITAINLKNDVGIKEFDLSESKKEFRNLFLSVRSSEEIEKTRLYNKTGGFVNCQNQTSLYHHKSENCLNCRFSMDCKELLKVKYRKLFKLRGYE